MESIELACKLYPSSAVSVFFAASSHGGHVSILSMDAHDYDGDDEGDDHMKMMVRMVMKEMVMLMLDVDDDDDEGDEDHDGGDDRCKQC